MNLVVQYINHSWYYVLWLILFDKMKKNGQDIGEWGLVVGFIALISVVTWFTIADKLHDIGSTLGNTLTQVSQQAGSAP